MPEKNPPSTPAASRSLIPVAFDTSVLVAAARSRTGASFALVSAQTADDALAFLRFLASHARLQDVYYHWRPFLPDPDDDMILELAFAANCRYIVTHNIRDYRGSEQLGVEAVTPRDFLLRIAQGRSV